MTIKDWKFTTTEGLVLDEHMTYPEDIKAMAIDMEMPDNNLSYAKVTIYQEDLQGVVFHIQGEEVSLPTDKILTFNPFVRAICDGLSGNEGVEQEEVLYILDGKEHNFKKKIQMNPPGRGQDLKILQRLQKMNMA